MNSYIKLALLLWGLCCLSANVKSQDTLITRASDTVLVLIDQVTEDLVRYRRYENQSQKREARLSQITQILYQDKGRNADYFLATRIRTPSNADTTQTLFVTTADGTYYIGKIIETRPKLIRFKTQDSDTLDIPKGDIRKMEEFTATSSVKNGEHWRGHLQSTTYLFQLNGFSLKRGETFLQNEWIFINQINHGLTDHLSVGFGLVPGFGLLFSDLPGFIPLGATPVWILPKVRLPIQSRNLNFSVGALFGTVIGSSGSGFSYLFGSSTLGSRDRNLSVGIGYGGSPGIEPDNGAVVTISGMYRVGKSIYLITENYLSGILERGEIISFGGRFAVNKASLEFSAIASNRRDGRTSVIPWFGFSVPLGR